MLRLLSIAFFLLLIITVGHSQELSQNSHISILTEAGGSNVYNTFGHTAVRIKDDSLGLDHVYNYGVFDFKTDNFYIKFLRGKLLYTMTISQFQSFVSGPKYQKRALTEQILNLSQKEKKSLYKILQQSAKPENRQYLYDFYYKNCATKVIEFIDQAVQMNYNYSPTPTTAQFTYRQLLGTQLLGQDWTEFGMNLILGKISDLPTTYRSQSFLPLFLKENLNNYKNLKGQSIIKSDQILLPYPDIFHQPFNITPYRLILGLLFLELFLLLKIKDNNSKFLKIYDKFWFIIIFVASLILLLMWLGTDHLACQSNFNLLWLNPLIILFFMTKNPIKGIVVSVIILFCIFLTLFDFLIPQHMLLSFKILATIIGIKVIRRANVQYNLIGMIPNPFKKKYFTISSVFLLFICSCQKAYTPNLPDPLEAGWKGEKVCEVLEDNDRIRVLRCSFAPGIGHEKHKHEPHFGYTLKAGTFEINQDDSIRQVNVPEGYFWYKKETSQHEVKNIGKTESTYLIIEPK